MVSVADSCSKKIAASHCDWESQSIVDCLGLDANEVDLQSALRTETRVNSVREEGIRVAIICRGDCHLESCIRNTSYFSIIWTDCQGVSYDIECCFGIKL